MLCDKVGHKVHGEGQLTAQGISCDCCGRAMVLNPASVRAGLGIVAAREERGDTVLCTLEHRTVTAIRDSDTSHFLKYNLRSRNS